jgi:flavin-dependent dehydrogenase
MYDAIVVGGGPAGSTCARVLARAGARVAVIDRAEFPRVKLCAGWLSPPFWDAVGATPAEYPRGLWEWSTCHVKFHGRQYALSGKGWFIRRYELDDWLLHRSGAELHLGTSVKEITRDGGVWQVGELRAKYLVGAGGTHCPVARLLDPTRPRRAVGVQELELPADPVAIARTRLGNDGEPELLLFDDVSGYGWNVPKRDWLNVGCGTLDATRVRGAWELTREQIRAHVPAEADLTHVKGHSYYLFDPVHLDAAERDGALLVGDSLGLAHPITAEGIVPAVVSGRLAAEAILDGSSYRAKLRGHPVLGDFRRVHAIVEVARRLRRKGGGGAPGPIARRAVAKGFAWMFSGARLPAPALIDAVMEVARVR